MDTAWSCGKSTRQLSVQTFLVTLLSRLLHHLSCQQSSTSEFCGLCADKCYDCEGLPRAGHLGDRMSYGACVCHCHRLALTTLTPKLSSLPPPAESSRERAALHSTSCNQHIAGHTLSTSTLTH